jgi:hypothetical protein
LGKSIFGEINNVAELASLKDLRKTKFDGDDVEIRIWRGFGLSDLEGIAVKRIKNEWSGVYIKSNDYIDATSAKVVRLNAPKSGWDSFWKKINEAEILKIPDNSEINCDSSGFDGMSYVVEYVHKYQYRTYMYSLVYSECAEAKKLENIGNIFAEEFDTGEGTCKTTEWIPCARLRRNLPIK